SYALLRLNRRLQTESTAPTSRAYRGKIVLTDNCNLTQGRCYAFCPRTPTDLEALSRQIFGKPYSGDSLGNAPPSRHGPVERQDRYLESPVRRPHLRSRGVGLEEENDRRRGSDQERKDLLSAGQVATNQRPGPRLRRIELHRLPPCRPSTRALKILSKAWRPWAPLARSWRSAKMRINPLENKNPIEKLSLVIGLFCTWALSYREMLSFLKHRISGGAGRQNGYPASAGECFPSETSRGARNPFPGSRSESSSAPLCTVCLDLTAEFSDLSIGAGEGIRGGTR
ncbi:MAG: Coenzyme F420 hydrogenase/dehydrogenase, beta subunit C-terminal domain, partial [Bacillus subtilis]|nr:Coenzyme F420 hydrogenase/dehydrogenase, beta subunit C-terminal domain [Bacillus subtilis]